jgi:hypothetical protein
MATILTLTNLLPDIYNAMDTVARERVGFIPAVARDSTAERAAIGEIVRSPVVGAMPAEDLTSSNVSATPPTQSISNVSMEITKSRSVPFGINGEETKGLQNAGTLGSINQQRIEQALRTLTNEIEVDLASQHIYASRAYGTATGTPFNTANDLSDFSNTLRILEENGAPSSDLHMVLGSASVNRLRGKQSGLFSLNTGGSVAEELLRRGSITAAPVMGFDLHQSAAVKTLVTAGTSNSAATSDAAGYAVGSTVITLASAGTGSLIAGDIITFANDTNEYVLAAGDTDTSNGGSITLAAPGLRQALPASAVTITLIAATTRNMAFHRSAIQLATRAPAMPEGGDDADDMMLVTDPVSGITYEFIVYRQKRQIRYEINLAWGFKTIKPEFVSLLIGA